MRRKIKIIQETLWLKILFALAFGLLAGILLSPQIGLVDKNTAEIIGSWLAIPGYIFLGAIQMIIIPLILASIVKGVAGSGSFEQIKIIGSRIIVYFLITTTIAITIGLSLGLAINPGKYVDSKNQVAKSELEIVEEINISLETFPEIMINIIPTNPLGAMVERDMLAVVLFALIIGLGLLRMSSSHAKPIMGLMKSIQEVCLVIVRWVMKLVPLAVFGLLAEATIKMGLDILAGMGVYVLTVILGLILMLGVYLLIVFVIARYNPFEFLKNIREVQLLAFSTSSSAAVMPLSLEVAQEKLGIRETIAQFLIPLGTTINMDGTALYQAIATVFLAQVFGVDLSITALLVIVITTLGASIGSPGTPGVGIIILAMVLTSVGIPAAGIALIIGVDRILDMSRTVINVTGDLTASLVMDRLLGKRKVLEH